MWFAPTVRPLHLPAGEATEDDTQKPAAAAGSVPASPVAGALGAAPGERGHQGLPEPRSPRDGAGGSTGCSLLPRRGDVLIHSVIDLGSSKQLVSKIPHPSDI